MLAKTRFNLANLINGGSMWKWPCLQLRQCEIKKSSISFFGLIWVDKDGDGMVQIWLKSCVRIAKKCTKRSPYGTCVLKRPANAAMFRGVLTVIWCNLGLVKQFPISTINRMMRITEIPHSIHTLYFYGDRSPTGHLKMAAGVRKKWTSTSICEGRPLTMNFVQCLARIIIFFH